MLPIRQKTAQLWPRATWQNNGSLVLAAGTAAWWYCLGFVAVLWRCARQGCFGMRVCSPAKSLLWWAEGWFWTVPISGQALLKTEQRYCTGWLLQSTGFIADLHHLCQACVLPWSRQDTEMGRSWANWQPHLSDWNLTSLATFSWFFFFNIFVHLNDTLVTWTLEKADPGEDPRPGLPLLQFQTATSGDWVCCFPAEW